MANAPTIGLIGCGRWGKNILRDLRALGCEVHAAVRSDGSAENARSGGATSVVGSIEELPGVDGIVVATLAGEHSRVISEAAASRSVPIFCEKPLCLDADEADQLAADFGDRLFVMDKWRYHPGILEVARIAKSGELGAVQSLHMRRVTNQNPHQDTDTVWVHLPHDMSIALEVLGHLPEARSAIEERTDEGRIGLSGTLGGPPWVSVETSDAAPGHRRELRMVCAGGSVQLDGGWSDEVTVRRNGADEDEVRRIEGELPLLAELRAFAEYVKGGPPPKSSAAEGAMQVRRIAELGALAAAAEPVGR